MPRAVYAQHRSRHPEARPHLLATTLLADAQLGKISGEVLLCTAGALGAAGWRPEVLQHGAAEEAAGPAPPDTASRALPGL